MTGRFERDLATPPHRTDVDQFGLGVFGTESGPNMQWWRLGADTHGRRRYPVEGRLSGNATTALFTWSCSLPTLDGLHWGWIGAVTVMSVERSAEHSEGGTG